MTHTHTPALFPDVTQLAHIPVLPHLSQHLWLSACLRGLTNIWRAKQSNLRPTHRLMFPLHGSRSVHQRGRIRHASVHRGFHTSCSGVHIDKLPSSCRLIACVLHEHWDPCIWHQYWSYTLDANTVVAPQMAHGTAEPTSSLHGYK